MNYKYPLLCFCFFLSTWNLVFAQRNLKEIPDTNPQTQQESFIVADGFEVNLYASDPAIAKPIQMNFDDQGRLWVASSSIYPQIEPGQKADDKIIVLEDQDDDGVAEKSTVFADGLLIPTGVLPGDGGVYVANSTELLHLTDTNDDGKADNSRVVLSGFGTEDTHHILHTLRWGHDGMMYFNQSIYIHSHIETPQGVRRLNGGGIWQFRPETMELEVLCKGFVNTWGHHFNQWGANFATDGAYFEGINYLFPNAVFVSSPGARQTVKGLNPGSPKHCGLEIISGGHLPDSWQGNCITNDFRAHRVCRFVLEEEGSGFVSRQAEELLKTKHGSFRPIDVKMGPDGAIYIADWYNPIIQHGEVDFRDPRRDHKHGRIWRVTQKNQSLLQRPDYENLSIKELLVLLKSKEEWVRLFAKLHLKKRNKKGVLIELDRWIEKLDSEKPSDAHLMLEGLWVYQAIDKPNIDYLQSLLTHQNHNVRAASLRVMGQWHDHFEDYFEVLQPLMSDSHPRVRLEAICAAMHKESLQAMLTVAQANQLPTDKYLDFALDTLTNRLERIWLPEVISGNLPINDQPGFWLDRFAAIQSREVVKPALELLTTQSLTAKQQDQVLNLVASRGQSQELGILFDKIVILANDNPQQATRLLAILLDTHQRRKVVPESDLQKLAVLLRAENPDLVNLAAQAAGSWKVESLREQLLNLAANDKHPAFQGAMVGLANLGGKESVNQLNRLSITAKSWEQKQIAIAEMSRIAPNLAARRAVELLEKMDAKQSPSGLLSPFLQRKGGQQLLVVALKDREIASELASAAIRVVRGSSQPSDALIKALEQSGKLTSGVREWTDQQLAEIVAAVKKSGDPVIGETIYRRKNLNCIKCHAIGEAGGLIGPNLISIGASAPIDYIVESLLRPNAKVKENFHSVIVQTDEGKVYSGIPVTKDNEQLILRDSEGKRIVVPLDSIEQQIEGRSLMPQGSVDSLSQQEIIHLSRFISELGKVGPYGPNNRQLVRRWEVLINTSEANRRINRTSSDIVATSEEVFQWQTEVSKVSGELPLHGLPTLTPHRNHGPLTFLRAHFEVTTPGDFIFKIKATKGISLWVDQSPTPLKEQNKVTWKKGKHQLVLSVARNDQKGPIAIELDEEKSSGRLQIINQKTTD